MARMARRESSNGTPSPNIATTLYNMRLQSIAFLATFAAASLAAHAGTAPAASGKGTLDTAVAPKEKSVFDEIWDLAHLYHDKDNSVIQDLWLTGRYHGQYHWSDSDTTSDDAYESRRFRAGLEAKLFNQFTIKGEMQSAADFDTFYNGFTELYVQWKPSDAFAVTVGKQKPKFTHDWSTSSRYHNYFERSQLLNEIHPDYTPGVSFNGKVGNFSYYTGIFSNEPSNKVGDEFSNFDGGESYIAQIGYDFASSLHTDQADWRLEYLHSENNEQSEIFSHFDDVVATSISLRDGRASLMNELTYGFGSADGDVFGVNFQPGYFLTDKLQVVGRYQVATSDGAEGITAQKRYEKTVGLGKGDLYQAGYAGLNYSAYGHKMKFMGGVEYATLGGHESWTALLGVRIFWGPESKGSFPVAYPKTNE